MMNSVFWKCMANACCIFFYLDCFLLKKGVRNIFSYLAVLEREERWMRFPCSPSKAPEQSLEHCVMLPACPTWAVATSVAFTPCVHLGYVRMEETYWELCPRAAGPVKSHQSRGAVALLLCSAQVPLPGPLLYWSCLCLPSLSCQRPLL